MRLLPILALLLAALLPAQAQTQPNLRPVGMKLFPDTQKGHFGTPLPGLAFAETQQRQLLLIVFDKAAAGQSLTFTIRAVATTESNSSAVYETTTKVTELGVAPLQVKLPQNWPVGRYDVLVTKEGGHVAALPYRVVADPPRVTELSFGDVAIARITEPGKNEPAEPPKPGDRHLGFAVKISGTNTAGVNLTWALTAIDTIAGAREVHRADDPARAVDNTEVRFDVAVTQDWPIGRYRVDLFADGVPSVSRGFTIGN